MSTQKRFQQTLKVSLCMICATFFLTITALGAEKGISTGHGVNVRSEASTNSLVVGQLNKGDEVTVYKSEDNFFQIKLVNGVEGYISDAYIELSASQATIKGNGVNLRKEPNTGAEIVGKMDHDAVITATGQSPDWIEVIYGNEKAFVHIDFIQGQHLRYLPAISEKSVEIAADHKGYAVVSTASGLKLRQEPETTATELAIMPYGSSFEIINETPEWVEVRSAHGDGYLHKDFVTIQMNTPHAMTNSRGEEVANYAKEHLGTPYKWAGTNLDGGVDCSGFVYAVFNNFGITLNRSSRDMASNGTTVERSNLAPGDLVFFATGSSSSINHVGIYIGNGDFIHSSSGKAYAVVISSMTDGYYVNRYVTGRKVL